MASSWDVQTGSDPAPRFVLLGELATGGMGSVDLVRMTDASGERIAAMKRMHPQFARDAEFIQMFRDEIWLTRALHHENVVELVGWGEDDEGPYLVMEFVDGAPLAEIVYQARRVGTSMPEDLLAYVAARVADGLHAAHTLTDAEGRPLALVHRDITPSNVLVGFDGSIKITDFGIAKAAASSSHTRTGIVKGKLEYMSPEHALRRAVDGRSDLYSLGSVMFEVLAGETPVSQGSDLELLKRIVYETVPPLASKAGGVDPELAALVDRLLAKQPEQRPADGASVARALDAWLASRSLLGPVLRVRLGEYASRFGAARRRRLRKLLAKPGTEISSSSSWRDPKRVRPATAPRAGTFLRAGAAGSTRKLRVGEADIGSGPRVSKETRPVSVAPPPVPSAPVTSEPVAAPPQRTPVATEPAATRRVSVAPPPPPLMVEVAESPPQSRKRRTWLPVLGGVLMALLLITAVALFGMRSTRSDPAPSAAPPELPETELSPTLEPTQAAATTEPPVTAAPESRPEPSARPATRAGQKRPPAARVQSAPQTKSRSKPCTPESFDYPGCLSR